MVLDKNKLLTFNREIKDVWVQNLTLQQRELVSDKKLFVTFFRYFLMALDEINLNMRINLVI